MGCKVGQLYGIDIRYIPDWEGAHLATQKSEGTESGIGLPQLFELLNVKKADQTSPYSGEGPGGAAEADAEIDGEGEFDGDADGL